MVTLIDSGQLEVGRFTLPDHPRELSWTVLRSIEKAVSDVLGERWMEEQ